MKNKKLLAIVLLSLSFCFVSGVGDADTSDVGEGWTEALRKKIQESRLPKRYTFLVIFIGEESYKQTLPIFKSFLDMYPDSEIPEEFVSFFPTAIGTGDFLRSTREYYYLIESLLLTMAYQQDYEIEHVTSSYVILVKSVYEEELKE